MLNQLRRFEITRKPRFEFIIKDQTNALPQCTFFIRRQQFRFCGHAVFLGKNELPPAV